jgi:polysaccharide deacetylase family protein (PEP-CTERM system associated)
MSDRKVPNFLTLDIEEWFHANYDGVDSARFANQETRLEALVDRLIDLCARHSVHTTCFVLGSVAKRSPVVVKKLHQAGHEIASHGYGHESVKSMVPTGFKADLAMSCDVLEQITGEKVLGFRAPSFSVRRENLEWFYPTLEEAGLRYSSSVFPGQTFLYGIPGFPEHIHYPTVGGRRSSVLEIPMPVIRFLGHDMGLYMRFFPTAMLSRKVTRDNKAGKSVVFYVHPREIDPQQPRLPLPYLQGLIHYWGINSCEKKLDMLMKALPGRLNRICDTLSLWPR